MWKYVLPPIRVPVSDLTGDKLNRGVEVSCFDRSGGDFDNWPVRHFNGANEMIVFALTKSPNKDRIRAALKNHGIEFSLPGEGCDNDSCCGGC